MLIDRLVFGTARLVGGAGAREARALLEHALTRGIRHIDTAPVYGSGTAEALVGDVLAGRSDIRITTKVGLEPPAHGWLLGYARRLRAALRTSPATLAEDFGPALALERNHAAMFGLDAMRRSFDRSLRRLRRERVDLLLLHDPGRDDLNPTTIGFLDAGLAGGRARGVGYATGAALAPAIDGAAPADWTAQVAPPSGWIGGASLPRTPLVVHSIAKTWFHAKRRDEVLAAAMVRAIAAAGPAGAPGAPGGVVDPLSFELAVLYALTAAWLPGAALVFATTDMGRLDAFLAAIRQLESATTLSGLTSMFMPAR